MPGVANPAFRPTSLEAIRPRVQAAVNELLDQAPKDHFEAAHLSFGYGAHFCIGANLARIQLEALVRSLLERLPGIRLNPAAAPVLSSESLMFRGFKSLPVLVS